MTDSTPYKSLRAIGDTIGDAIAAHIDLTFRQIMSGPNVEIQPGFLRLITGEPHPFGNFACIRAPLNPQTTTQAIEQLVNCPAPSAVFLTAAVPGEIHQQLNDAGFECAEGMPCMGVEIDKLPPTQLPDGYTFERVSKAEDRQQWADVFARGYELPLPIGTAFAGGINDDNSQDAPIQYFWIKEDDHPVCTSLVHMHEGVAGIYGVATLREARGKGLGAHVTAQPLHIAKALGYSVGILQASEDGHPVYQRIGFEDFGHVSLYLRMPSA